MLVRFVRLSAIFLLMFGIAASEAKTPLSFWLDFVKGRLRGPNADQLFINQYKQALLPGQATAYLEGSVVSVVRTSSTARTLLLSAISEHARRVPGVPSHGFGRRGPRILREDSG